MNKLLFTLALAVSASVFAAESVKPIAPASTAAQNPKKISKDVLQRMQMRQFGGFVKDVRTQRGKIVVVNAQSAADAAWFDEVVVAFDKMTKISIEVAPGTFDLVAPKLQGTASVFVVDDPKLPMSLVAPEAKWTMVNVAPLKCDKTAFFQARVRKQLTRSLAYLFGAADSQYPMCLTGCVTKPEDLDQFVYTSKLPMDIQLRMEKYIPSLGITPYTISTYKNAVIEGWAAQPTNDYQKAIWEEVHQLPTAPLTIKPEEKKVAK